MSAGGRDGVLDGSDRPCGTARRLVGRVDALRADVNTMGRDMVEMSNAVKTLLAARPAGPVEADAADGPGPQRKGQPEWLGCRSSVEAEVILTGTSEWVQTYGRRLGLEIAPCWPWHPMVVVLLLAATEQHQAAYRGKVPAAVTEFLTVRLPAIARQVRAILHDAECNENTHREPGDSTQYTAHPEQLPDLAVWWTDSRAGSPPGLTRRLEAAR